MLRVKALDHVALKVRDMEKTLTFYHKLLGAELLRVSEMDEAGARTAVLKLGHQEINLFSRPYFTVADQQNLVGVEHFCLVMDVPSINDLVTALHEVGLTEIRGPKRFSGGESVFVYDPDGLNVELRVEDDQ